MNTYFRDGDYDVDALDKVQIAALRKADTISFHHNDGKSYIVATKRKERTERDPFADDVRVNIRCKWSLVNYESNDPNDAHASAFSAPAIPGDKFKAFEMLHSPSHTDHWQTTASLLKPGDVLTLKWVRGGKTTDGMRDAQFVGDDLFLRVQRGDKSLTFHVGDTICQRYSTARMVRA